MVNIGHRLRNLDSLLNLRTGPGAAILPKDVTRIHMRFALRLEGGHMGPRKFFRENLPRLKFHNPTIPMIVQRNDDNAGPATLSIYFREATGSATAAETPWGITSSRVMDGSIEPPAPGPGERVLTINMRGAHSEKILKDFLTKTGAVAVPISPRDEALKRKLEELEVYAEIDRARVLKEHQDYKREKRMLEQAQSEAAALKAEME
ncbi:CI-B8 domain-containing protein [Dichotomopilus funicola]|uniref:CI-B8 domain-containing protein n=1 Tax=Dichotomopilus funicola TaxID=1934379 RepID=A0AAN6UV58_9PEZI|nr:CI-B8 domain-containing protein [Dichotomopilus funicola]